MEVAVNVYDEASFFSSYASMERSRGLEWAGEWPTLEALLAGIHGGRVLDLGCGYGWHADYLSRRGCKVTALDSSHSMLEEARRRFPSIDFRCQDILDYDYPEDEYDLVFSNLAFHYIEDLEGLNVAVKIGTMSADWAESIADEYVRNYQRLKIDNMNAAAGMQMAEMIGAVDMIGVLNRMTPDSLVFGEIMRDLKARNVSSEDIEEREEAVSEDRTELGTLKRKHSEAQRKQEGAEQPGGGDDA